MPFSLVVTHYSSITTSFILLQKYIAAQWPNYFVDLRPIIFSRERSSTGSNDCFVDLLVLVLVVVVVVVGILVL
jgi:hypothetical protein